MSKILIPINNNDSRETTPLNLPQGIATIYVFVNADKDLLVEVYQSFDGNLTYDKIESKQYSASNGGTAFYFDKVGADAVLKLTNNSGQDCTFTRAYLDYIDSSISSGGSSVSTDVSDAQTHSGLSNITATLQAGISVNNTDFAFLSDINTTLNGTLDVLDASSEALLNDINTVLNAGLNTSDGTTHNKLDEVNSNINVINNTLQGTINVDAGNNVDIRNLNKNQDKVEVYPGTEELNVSDSVSQGLLSNIDVKLNTGVIDTCSKLCRPLQVKSIFINTAGTNGVNIIDGPFKLVSFIFAHNDAQGLLTFYDLAASATPPTVTSTSVFFVGTTTTTVASPTFPTSSYVNFNNGLWLRLSANLDPNNTANDAGTITIFYET